ncbi:septum formation initiator family protein [Halomonas denitrificans]|nr:septum formation initiator family protein [Halomonas denitrificans]
MRVMMAVLVLLLVVLQVSLWRQYGQIGDLRRQVEDQLERNRVLRERNDALAAEVADLKSGLEAVEERARAELGLVRDGERFFLVVDPDDLPEGQTDALRELESLPGAAEQGAPQASSAVDPDPAVADEPPADG